MTNSKFLSLVGKLQTVSIVRHPEGSFNTLCYVKKCTSSPVIYEVNIENPDEFKIYKAEDLIYLLVTSKGRLVRLGEDLYFAGEGMLMKDPTNPLKRKILYLTQRIREIPDRYIVFDGSLLCNSNEPVARFTLRKLIPTLSAIEFPFGFGDLSDNLLKPVPPVSTDAFDDIRDEIADMFVDCKIQ